MRTFIYLLAAPALVIALVAVLNSAPASVPAAPSNATSGRVKTFREPASGTTTAEVTVRLPAEGAEGFACRAVSRHTKAEAEAHGAAVEAEKSRWFGRLRSPDFSGFPKVTFSFLAFARGKKFSEADRLSLLIDGERWEPQTEYKYSVDWKTTGNTFEEINAPATAERLRQIADARKVSVTLGRTQFELSAAERAPLGELAAYALGLRKGAP
jgi:hypothetical protein